jgi:hypothetical protein
VPDARGSAAANCSDAAPAAKAARHARTGGTRASFVDRLPEAWRKRPWSREAIGDAIVRSA